MWGLKWLPGIVNKVIGANGSLTKSNLSTAKSFSFLGGGATALAAKFGIVVIAARRLGAMVGNWITKSNEYVENLNLFNVSMGKYAEEALAYAQKINKSMGVDMSEWIRNQGIIMDMSKSFGVAEESAYKMSKALTQLAYDFSSLYNIKVADSMLKIQSALAGEIEPVRRLGKDISAAKLQMVLFNMGIDANVEKLSQSNKAMLRTIALLQQSGSAMGDFARTMDSPANQMRILNARIAEFARAMGNLFMPMISAALPYVIAFVQIVTEAVNALASLFGFKLPKFDYSGLESTSSSIGNISDNLDDASSSAKKMQKSLLGIDELNVMQKKDTGADKGNIAGSGLGGVLSSELDRLAKEYDEKFANVIKQKSEEIANSMRAYFQPLIPFFQGIGFVLGAAFSKLKEWHDTYFYPWLVSVGEWMKENPETLRKIGELVAGIALAFVGWKTISGILTPVFTVIKTLVSAFSVFSATGAIGKLFAAGGLFSKTGAIATGFLQLFGHGGIISQAFIGFASALGIGTGALAAIVAGVVAFIAIIAIWGDEIKEALQKADDFLQNIFVKDWKDVFGNVLGEALNSFFTNVKNIWDSIKKVFDGIIDFIRGVFTGDWERAWTGIKNIFSGVFDSLVSVAKIPINGIIGLLNTAIDGINALISGLNTIKFDIPKWLGGGTFGINIPLIPKISYFENGGFPKSGEMFMARENGIPEMVGAIGNRTAVANNNQIVSSIKGGVSEANESVVKAVYAMANAVVNAIQQNKDVVIDGEKITSVVVNGINGQTQQTGYSPLVF